MAVAEDELYCYGEYMRLENDNVRVSIIIPTYNVEGYIGKCLDSCVNQSLDGCEIVIIDDASSDNTRSVIESYLNNVNYRIRVIQLNQNRGPGYARNCGIKVAAGDYLFFLDGDDYLEEDACKTLYDKARETGADIVMCDYYSESDDKKRSVDYLFIAASGDDCRFCYMVDATQCGKLIRRSLIIDNGLFYSDERFFYEDSAVSPIWILMAHTIVKINIPLWTYVMRQGSTIHTRDDQWLELDLLRAIAYMDDSYVRRFHLHDGYGTEIETYYLVRILDTYNRIIRKCSIFENRSFCKLREAIIRFAPNRKTNSIADVFFTFREKKIIEYIADGVFEREQDGIATSYLEKRFDDKDQDLFELYKDKFIETVNGIQKMGYERLGLWAYGIKGRELYSEISDMDMEIAVSDMNERWIGKMISGRKTVMTHKSLIEEFRPDIILITNNNMYQDAVNSSRNIPIINIWDIIHFDQDIRKILTKKTSV